MSTSRFAPLLLVLLSTTLAAQTRDGLTSGTRTLQDVARERKLGIRGVKGGTLSVAGAPVSYLAPSLASAPTPGADETEWTRRNAEARGEFAAARGALAQAESALPIVSVGTRPNAINVILQQQREAALLPYRARANEARAAVDALPEAARKAGAEPGWVRPTSADDTAARETRKISLAETERQINNGDAPLPTRDQDRSE